MAERHMSEGSSSPETEADQFSSADFTDFKAEQEPVDSSVKSQEANKSPDKKSAFYKSPNYDPDKEYPSRKSGHFHELYDPITGEVVFRFPEVSGGALGGPWASSEQVFKGEQGEVKILVPDTLPHKHEWMRTFLMEIEEKGAEIHKDPTLSRRVKDMQTVIYSLSLQPPGTPERAAGERMHKEFSARINILEAYMAFQGADKGEAVQEAMKKIDAEYLDFLFSNKEFVHALNEYIRNGYDFDDKEKYGVVTRDLANEEFRKKVDAALGLKVGLGGAFPTAENIAWNRNLAEMFWKMSGMRVRQAKSGMDDDGKHMEFKAGFSKGERVFAKVLRRDINFQTKDAKIKGVKGFLLDGVDLQEGDFFQQILGRAGFKYNKETHSYDYNPADNKISIEAGVDLSGVINSTTGEINFANPLVNWGTVDFKKAFGGKDTPLAAWVEDKIRPQDEVLTAMLEENGFLVSPSTKSLIEGAKKLSYQKDKAGLNQAQMGINLINWASNNPREAEAVGLSSPNLAMQDTMVDEIARELKLDKEHAQRLLKETVGDSLWAGIRVASSYLSLGSALWVFFREIFMGILKASISTK